MDMEGELNSVYVLVRYVSGPYRCGLYEIKIQKGGQVMGLGNVLDPVVTFFDRTTFVVPDEYFRVQGASLALDTATMTTKLPGSSSNTKFYLLLNEGLNCFNRFVNTRYKYDSYSGYTFDTRTRSLETLKRPLASKPVSFFMSAYGKLYNIASPVCFIKMPDTLFERYNPNSESWESLPHFEYSRDKAHMDITGYAVCYGCILVSLGRSRVELMVFNIDSNTWHQVNIARSDAYYCGFRGRAVVVDNTIYALSIQCGKVIGFSLMIYSEDDGRIIYFLEKPVFFPGFKSRVKEDLKYGHGFNPTEYLVHLGKLEFCLLQAAATCREDESQELFVTTFKIVHDGTMHIRTLYSSVCDLRIKGYGLFDINFSFTPECRDLEPRKEEIFQMTRKKETAKNNAASDSKVHDVGIEGSDRFMLLPRKLVLGKYPFKFDVSRLAVIPSTLHLMVAVFGLCLFFVLGQQIIS
ncbi:hypothetical protein ACFX1T_038943 [Malus domestica]